MKKRGSFSIKGLSGNERPGEKRVSVDKNGIVETFPNPNEKKAVIYYGFRCPTMIRTLTDRTRICSATITP